MAVRFTQLEYSHLQKNDFVSKFCQDDTTAKKNHCFSGSGSSIFFQQVMITLFWRYQNYSAVQTAGK